MSEFELQCQCVDLLRAYQFQGKIDFFTSIPNSLFVPETKYKSPKNGFDFGRAKILNKNRASGLHPGLPDLFILAKGKQFWVELKVGYNKLSEGQEDVINKLNQNDTQAIIAYSFDEFRVGVDTLLKGEINEPNNAYYELGKKGSKELIKLFDKNNSLKQPLTIFK